MVPLKGCAQDMMILETKSRENDYDLRGSITLSDSELRRNRRDGEVGAMCPISGKASTIRRHLTSSSELELQTMNMEVTKAT